MIAVQRPRSGVTPLAVVISTVFWTWLWGPFGLILAMPITVCLLVLGRHVESLHFFEILLGDQPALTPAQRFYQRTLSGDAAEATYQAELCLKDERTLQSYLDAVAIEGLKLAQQDAERGVLDADQAERMNATVREMLDNLSDFEPRRWFAKLRRKVEKDDKETGGLASLDEVVAAEPDVFAFNLETTRRLFPVVRPSFDYDAGLEFLAEARRRFPATTAVKSNIIAGMGEADDEIRECMRDLRGAGVQLLTIGQYLQPSAQHLHLDRYVTPEQFAEFRRYGEEELGFDHVESGPMVRSSYHAGQQAMDAGAWAPSPGQPGGEPDAQSA